MHEQNRAFVEMDGQGAVASRGQVVKSGSMQLTLGGELNITTLPAVWTKVAQALRQRRPERVAIDVSPLEYSDSACLALFAEVRRILARDHAELKITGLKPALRALLEMAELEHAAAPELAPPRQPGFVTRTGEAAAGVIAKAKQAIAFFGELSVAFVWAAMHPRLVRWRDLLISCEKAGANALPVVLVLGFLIGVMLAFQTAEQTERYGIRTVIPSVVAIAITRELGPLIAALLLAGRTGSALAAELGTMKINQELNALRAMGLDPVRFLAVPRVASLILMTPLLAIFCDLAGILGGYTVMADHGFSFLHYIVQAAHALNWPDVFGGVGKTVVDGFLVGAAGCLYGINTRNSPRAVGDATTGAVVSSIIMIVAADGCFGVIYYYFNI